MEHLEHARGKKNLQARPQIGLHFGICHWSDYIRKRVGRQEKIKESLDFISLLFLEMYARIKNQGAVFLCQTIYQ